MTSLSASLNVTWPFASVVPLTAVPSTVTVAFFTTFPLLSVTVTSNFSQASLDVIGVIVISSSQFSGTVVSTGS